MLHIYNNKDSKKEPLGPLFGSQNEPDVKERAEEENTEGNIWKF